MSCRVSLEPILRTLWERYPRPEEVRGDPLALARGLRGGDRAERALAIGAFNALSRWLMRRAGFKSPDRAAAKEVATMGATGPVDMVGYFCPVIDRRVEAGREVPVLEQQPARMPGRPQVRLTTRPAALADCGQVMCTASVLINDTLDELLSACGKAAFELIGPTGSGLPDALFACGVQAVSRGSCPAEGTHRL